jgi:hypothetical protein
MILPSPNSPRRSDWAWPGWRPTPVFRCRDRGADTITIPGYVLDVEVVVTAATVDWGDEIVDTFPSEAYPQLTGYPDGLARHVYEAKTCTPPGSADDCHPDLEAYPVTISYEWGARWRANGGPWIDVGVPPSSTSVLYPVTEAVSSLTETG